MVMKIEIQKNRYYDSEHNIVFGTISGRVWQGQTQVPVRLDQVQMMLDEYDLAKLTQILI